MTTEPLVTQVLAEVTRQPAELCSQREQSLAQNLGLDSLGLLEVVTKLQLLAACVVPDEVTGQVRTVGDLHRALEQCASTPASRIALAEEYLRGHRSLAFERQNRFLAAADRLRHHGLSDADLLYDLGAGYTELDYHLRVQHGWRGRYVPVDAWVDGTDLLTWTPPRRVGWFAALELLEHLADPLSVVNMMKAYCTGGFVVTTPNPATVDVLAQDPTHVTPLPEGQLQAWGMDTTLHNFYGQYQDGICAVWRRQDSEG